MSITADRLTFTTAHQQPAAIAADRVRDGDRSRPQTSSDSNGPATFDIVTTRDAFNALESEWTRLFQQAGENRTVFQSFNWHWHWCNHFLAPKPGSDEKPGKLQLFIVTVRRCGRLVMIWPLALQQTAAIKQLIWIGDPVSQYGDIIAQADADNTALLQQSWDFINDNSPANLIYLRKVRADALVAPFLQAEGLPIVECQEAISHDLRKDGNFENYSKRHKPRARRNRNRQLRRMEESGTVAFKVQPPGPEARTITLEAIAMKRVWLAEKGQVSRAYTDPRFDDFFAALAMGDDHPSGCCVSVLSCGDKTAAVEIGLNANDIRFMHIIVYNLQFERFGAGAQHMNGSIKHAFDQGLKTFDLLAPNTRYKTDWGDGITRVCDYAIGNTPVGKAYLWCYLKNLRPAMKAAIERIPRRARRLLASH